MTGDPGLKRSALAVLTIACVLLLPIADAAGGARTIVGQVRSSDGEALEGAVVRLKNTRTLRIRSFVSTQDGRYHFSGIHPDVDYEVSATYRGRSSSTKTVSQFDSKELVTVDLEIRNQ